MNKRNILFLLLLWLMIAVASAQTYLKDRKYCSIFKLGGHVFRNGEVKAFTQLSEVIKTTDSRILFNNA